jgi:hypothetical protein
LERQPIAETLAHLEVLAGTILHEQMEDPDQGMIPNQSCPHCWILLSALPQMRAALAESEGRVAKAREAAMELADAVIAIQRGQMTIEGMDYERWNGPDVLLAQDKAHKLRAALRLTAPEGKLNE